MVTYTGRFAPSPTGPLHFGSLIAALASYLEARVHGGQWLLRIEDVDAPRTLPGASDTILRQLETYGFTWDGPVLWQSQRLDAYRAVLDDLYQRNLAYPCVCTRREIADSTLLAPDGAHRYPGTCRNGLPPGRTARAWRLRTEPGTICWLDAIQGCQEEDVWRDVGDFVLLRADGQFAYQLAVVIDDAWQGITHIVRGADLLNSTGRQIYLQRLLGITQPTYAHLPIATDQAGEKLSKQTRAHPLTTTCPAARLRQALRFLGQNVPKELSTADLAEVWDWALAHWQLAAIPNQRQLVLLPEIGQEELA